MSDTMQAPFVKGSELSQRFFEDAIGPLMASHFPRLPYTAGRIGSGSDVLGFDTPQSRDHDWGPRLTLFLRPEDVALKSSIDEMLRRHLPFEIAGYPTHYGRHEDGTTHLVYTNKHPVNHNVLLTTIPLFFRHYLAHDFTEIPTAAEWLTFPQQHLCTIRHGRVFHDDLGLANIRQTLHWYPHDLWLYILAGQWLRLDQEASFVGRTGDVGDEFGSRLIAARQVENLIRLCFLMEKEYPPYAKWLGTAFKQLPQAHKFEPIFAAVFAADDWRTREAALAQGYKLAIELQNKLQLAPYIDTTTGYFHNRPYLVFAGACASALYDAIQGNEAKSLPNIGSIDQFVDSTDVLSVPARAAKLKAIYK